METPLIFSMLPSWTRCWKTLALPVSWGTTPLLWLQCACVSSSHHSDAIMIAMASQITGVLFVCSTVCSGAGQRKHHSYESLAFVTGIHRWPVDSPHKGPVTRNMFPFDDVIMVLSTIEIYLPTFRLLWWITGFNHMNASLLGSPVVPFTHTV